MVAMKTPKHYKLIALLMVMLPVRLVFLFLLIIHAAHLWGVAAISFSLGECMFMAHVIRRCLLSEDGVSSHYIADLCLLIQGISIPVFHISRVSLLSGKIPDTDWLAFSCFVGIGAAFVGQPGPHLLLGWLTSTPVYIYLDYSHCSRGPQALQHCFSSSSYLPSALMIIVGSFVATFITFVYLKRSSTSAYLSPEQTASETSPVPLESFNFLPSSPFLKALSSKVDRISSLFAKSMKDGVLSWLVPSFFFLVVALTFSSCIAMRLGLLGSRTSFTPEEVLIALASCFVLSREISRIDMAPVAVVFKANQELAEEKTKMELLLRRQYDLIEVLKSMPGDESQRGNDATDFNNKLSYLHEQLAEEVSVSPAKADDIKLLTVLGRGSFGTVYLGEWRGAAVAVKRIVLPAAMSNSERAQKMAVMEIAISSSMCHPNLVQTYTYSIKQLRDQEYDDGVKLIGGSGSHVNAHEMRLVLEYCDRGSLASYLKHHQGMRDISGSFQIANLIETAADIVKGMLHLHMNDICHNDLKAANVLLKSEGTDGRGVRAKVMDFGLSIKLDSKATHVSNLFQGTVTHMAPEILMEGKQSKSADVYAFGITLWELCSGRSAYNGIPQMALGQVIVFKHKRPSFPKDTPPALIAIAELCWHPKASSRPTFQVILDELQKIKESIAERPLPFLNTSSSGDMSQTSGLADFRRDDSATSLSTAQYISETSSAGFDNWIPTIMGDDRDRVGGSSIARFSEQVTYINPAFNESPDYIPSSGLGGAPHSTDAPKSSSRGESISFKNPSSGRPSLPSDHSSAGLLPSSQISLMKHLGSKESAGSSLRGNRGTSLQQFITSEIMPTTSSGSKGAPRPASDVQHMRKSPDFGICLPASPASTTKLNLSDLCRAQELAQDISGRVRHQGSSGIMTLTISTQKPSLEPFLQNSTSQSSFPNPSRVLFGPIQEEYCEHTPVPEALLEKLQRAGEPSKGKLTALMSPISMDDLGDRSPIPEGPSAPFLEHEASSSHTSRNRSISVVGSKRWLGFLSPNYSSAHFSRARSKETAGLGPGSGNFSKVLGLSSLSRDVQREEGAIDSSTKEKSKGASRSWFGGGGRSLRRLLGLESSKKIRER